MATDFLYCKFNEKGKKQFDAIERAELESKFPEYTKVGLPAHKAALDGNIECLKDLFSAYWNDGVPSRDVNGATPLHLAVRNSQLDAVKWILRYTTLSALDEAKFGETPVHVAAAQGNLECLKILLSAENKAEINALATAVDKSEFTVLYLAILKQCNDCAKYLISQMGAKGVGPFNDSGVTAAHIAASAGNVEVLKLIHQKFKKYISLPAADGTTPAYHAAQQGQLEALKFLVGKCKCKLTVVSEDGAKPIHAAAQCGKTNIVQYIVGQQGNKAVFDQGADKATPLHYVACNGHIETAEWLLKTDVSGRLISAKDKNGDTPAHDAAENGQTEMLKFLLDAGADLYVINDEGNTPYALALKGDNPETANFVMTEAAKSPKPNQQMPQVTIFDLQGDMDVVDVNPQRETATDDLEESVMAKPDKKSKKAAKKKKKRKNSLTSGLEQTLQSFEDKQASPKEETEPNDDGPLQFDDGGIELFENSQKADEDDDIVVRYTNKPGPAVLMTSEYATVNEVAKIEERKQRKKGRKMPKSIQNVLKSGKKKPGEPSETKKQSKGVFSGLGNMGFKSKSHVNPLLNARIPPTPPPTPATGASIAPSDEVPQQIVADVEEPELSPSQLEKKTSESMPKRKSENSMLLDDTLQHLSSDNSPPNETTDSGSKPALGSQSSFNSKVSSQSAGFAQAKNKFERFGPTTRQLRPPAGETKGAQTPSDDLSEAKHMFVKLKPTAGKVGSIAAAFSKPNEPSEGNRPPFAKLKPTPTTSGATPFSSAAAKKQPSKPNSGALSESATEGKTAIVKLKTAAVSSSVDRKPREEQSSASQEKEAFTKMKTTEEQSTASLDTSEAKNKFVQLKKVQKASGQVRSDATELSQIQLKKSTRSTPPRARAVFSKPGTEKASGASNELLKLMKDLSAK